MLTASTLASDTLILFGIVSFVGLFLGLAFLRLLVPEMQGLNSALHRLEGHLEFGGLSDRLGGTERNGCASDGSDGD